MQYKVNYELKTDSRGYKYALKINLQTGKKQRVKYDLAKKRISGLKSSRKKAVIVEKLKETESDATYKEYQKMIPVVEKEIRDKREKDGKKPYTDAEVRGKAKQRVIEHRTGYATSVNWAWTYRIVLDRYTDKDTGKEVIECDTPVFKARGLKKNGDHYTQMMNAAQKSYDNMRALDLCSFDGGACVVFYDKSDKEILKKFELGKGCGFSFDFKNYNDDDESIMNIESDGFDWI